MTAYLRARILIKVYDEPGPNSQRSGRKLVWVADIVLLIPNNFKMIAPPKSPSLSPYPLPACSSFQLTRTSGREASSGDDRKDLVHGLTKTHCTSTGERMNDWGRYLAARANISSRRAKIIWDSGHFFVFTYHPSDVLYICDTHHSLVSMLETTLTQELVLLR